MGDLKLLLGIIFCLCLPLKVLTVPAAALVKRQQPTSLTSTSHARRPTSPYNQIVTSLPTIQATQPRFTADSNQRTAFATNNYQGQNVYYSSTTGQQRPLAPTTSEAKVDERKTTANGKYVPTWEEVATQAGEFIGRANTEPGKGTTAPGFVPESSENTTPTDASQVKATSTIPVQKNTEAPTGTSAASSYSPVPTGNSFPPTSQAAAKVKATSPVVEPVALATTKQQNISDYQETTPAVNQATTIDSAKISTTEIVLETQNSTTPGQTVTTTVAVEDSTTVQSDSNDTSQDHTSHVPNTTIEVEATEQTTPVVSEGDLGNGTTASVNLQETMSTTVLPEQSSLALNQSTAQATTYGKTSNPSEEILATTEHGEQEKVTSQQVATVTTPVPHNRKRPPVDDGDVVTTTVATTTTTTTKISVQTKKPSATSIKQGPEISTESTSSAAKEDILHQIKNYTNGIVKQYGALKVTLGLLAIILLLFLTMFCCCKICRRKGYGIRQRRLKEFGQEKEFLLKDRGGVNSNYNNDAVTLLDGSSEDEF